MRKAEEIRVCKNKECQKILPDGYKYKYCEACRNQQAQTVKKVLKGVGVGAGTVATIAITLATGGKINLRK